MGATCSSPNHSSSAVNEQVLRTIRLKFDALSSTRSDDGHIIREDFNEFFNLPGIIGERLFNMFDVNHDGKIYWTEFEKGIEQCTVSDEAEFDGFIFHFCSLNDRIDLEFEELQSVLQHLPPSIFYLVVKSAEQRSDYAQKWVEKWSNNIDNLSSVAREDGLSVIFAAYFESNEQSERCTTINYHDFSVFLREQTHLREFFRTSFSIHNPIPTSTPHPQPGYTMTAHSTRTESYHLLPCDMVDPEVYKSKLHRNNAKWHGFARAYWSIGCNYCHKEVRFCCVCQGELKPLEKEKDDGMKHLQCTECHRVVSMRFCSACGHLFEDKVVDARMEIPGITKDVTEYSGKVYISNHFTMTSHFARVHNNFLYLYNNQHSETPSTVHYLEKATVKMYE